MQERPRTGRRQRGVATVLVTLVLLLAVGLISLYTSRSAIVEQRISANEVRAKQALAAASAGVDHALAYIRNGGLDQNSDNVVDTIGSLTLGTGAGTAKYRVVYASSTSVLPTCETTYTGGFAGVITPPTDLRQIAAVSCGWSDDDASVQRVVQRLTATPSLAGTVSTPMVTKSSANLANGSVSVWNYFNDLTIWTGGNLQLQSANGRTFIRNTADSSHANPNPNFDHRTLPANSAACTTYGGYICSTDGTLQGHDVVTGDTRLSSLSNDNFFEYFMGQSKVDYKRDTATLIVPGGPDASAAVANKNNSVIWVEGDLTLPSVGTAEKPVVLVVTGNLTVSGNASIYGVVLVLGNISGAGGSTFYGSLIGAGDVNLTGTPNIVYDPTTLTKAGALGKAAKLSGGWRDW